MATTFKIFKPNGDCRRITFDSVPELAAVNEVVDGMVEDEARDLTYIDSEGDRVIIKSSRDVAEAVRDAQETGAKTVKITIKPRRRAEGNRGKKTGGRGHCHAYRTGPRVFGDVFRSACSARDVNCDDFQQAAQEVADEVGNLLGAIFPHVFINGRANRQANEQDQAQQEQAQKQPEEARANSTPRTTADHVPEEEQKATDEASQIPPTSHEPLVEPHCTSPSPASESPSEQPEEDNEDLEAKATLLREMGFEIPIDAAKKMIRELGGRMDLIVRALVANSK